MAWKSKCDDPTCKGWLHMHDSCGQGPGIERCDQCKRFDDDDAAKEAHARECGCRWGEDGCCWHYAGTGAPDGSMCTQCDPDCY